MKKIMAFLWAAVFLAATGWADDAKPKMILQEETFDFGKVADQEALKHTFEVENKGTGGLLITRVQPSCGCTSALLSPQSGPIDPGKTGLISVSVDPHGKQGVVVKTVTIFSNDPLTPQKQIFIKADIIPSATMKQMGQSGVSMFSRD